MRQLLIELSRSVSRALSESQDLGRSVQKIRDGGLSLHLCLDGESGGEGRVPVALPAEGGGAKDPDFVINGSDLSFLRSVGIDPTRRLKRRRARQTSSKKPS